MKAVKIVNSGTYVRISYLYYKFISVYLNLLFNLLFFLHFLHFVFFYAWLWIFILITPDVFCCCPFGALLLKTSISVWFMYVLLNWGLWSTLLILLKSYQFIFLQTFLFVIDGWLINIIFTFIFLWFAANEL